MRVQHNIVAMNAYRNYNNNTTSINKNLEKLSSGYRVNRAGDDAAGLAISEKMRAQITGLETAQKNAKDGIGLVQTAEGALTEVHSMLNRMYALAEQSANGTYEEGLDRDQLDKEVSKLRDEIDRIGKTTNFNGIKLFATKDYNTVDLSTSAADSATNFTLAAGTFAGLPDELSGATISYTVSDPTTGALDSHGTVVTGNDNKNKWRAIFSGGLSDPTVKMTLTDGNKEYNVQLSVSSGASGNNGTITLGAAPAAAASAAATPREATAQRKLTLDDDVSLTGSGVDLWVGDSPDQGNVLNVDIGLMNSTSLVISAGTVNIKTQQSALDSLDYIKDAIDKVSDIRGTLGAAQNRLEHTINNLSVMKENIQDAESSIRDTDVAEEMMKYTKNSILVQSAQAMLAQANQQPQGVLQLLQ